VDLVIGVSTLRGVDDAITTTALYQMSPQTNVVQGAPLILAASVDFTGNASDDAVLYVQTYYVNVSSPWS
jgi:hypothetical protein